ncbi:bifunctional riboflavin kinase/FAD synthetase [Leptolyngbya sp. FACHB-36]|uniref:bifunctional riboflavin kinase/FAD synthetase n=1 Tax=Leptolyngbya sp. FACHB-36 TaxID=2692808 RepID=UPI001681C154|nr:bifunctional riboflavin kinase/FAD synthetase [Leptolyngbya sp. FACHB-36]
MWVTSSLATVLTPTAVALGNFDGVHRGHRQVVQPVLAARPGDSPRFYSTVVSFHPHPREFFTGQSRSLLTPLSEKVAQLQQLGVEQLVLLPFDRDLASLTPEQFVQSILVQRLQAVRISVGMDFCFGRERTGTATGLQAIGAAFGIDVTIAPLQLLDGERISSSAIRQALQTGDLSIANCYLGRSYELVGQVVQGQQLGRTIGFPTANLQLPAEKFLPSLGVYAVQVQVYETEQAELLQPAIGVMNLGNRPTINGTSQTIEVHLLDWSGDLYGRTLRVSLEKFLRPEQKFASLDDLKAQIQADCDSARALFAARLTEGEQL